MTTPNPPQRHTITLTEAFRGVNVLIRLDPQNTSPWPHYLADGTPLYTATKIAETVGIGYSRLDKWTGRGIAPVTIPADGSGNSPRKYTARDACHIVATKALIDIGLKAVLAGRLVANTLAGETDPYRAGQYLVSDGETGAIWDEEKLIDVAQSSGPFICVNLGAVRARVTAAGLVEKEIAVEKGVAE